LAPIVRREISRQSLLYRSIFNFFSELLRGSSRSQAFGSRWLFVCVIIITAGSWARDGRPFVRCSRWLSTLSARRVLTGHESSNFQFTVPALVVVAMKSSPSSSCSCSNNSSSSSSSSSSNNSSSSNSSSSSSTISRSRSSNSSNRSSTISRSNSSSSSSSSSNSSSNRSLLKTFTCYFCY
jgi:hypothetical protein